MRFFWLLLVGVLLVVLGEELWARSKIRTENAILHRALDERVGLESANLELAKQNRQLERDLLSAAEETRHLQIERFSTLWHASAREPSPVVFQIELPTIRRRIDWYRQWRTYYETATQTFCEAAKEAKVDDGSLESAMQAIRKYPWSRDLALFPDSVRLRREDGEPVWYVWLSWEKESILSAYVVHFCEFQFKRGELSLVASCD
jgi:hypothetical protein